LSCPLVPVRNTQDDEQMMTFSRMQTVYENLIFSIQSCESEVQARLTEVQKTLQINSAITEENRQLRGVLVKDLCCDRIDTGKLCERNHQEALRVQNASKTPSLESGAQLLSRSTTQMQVAHCGSPFQLIEKPAPPAPSSHICVEHTVPEESVPEEDGSARHQPQTRHASAERQVSLNDCRQAHSGGCGVEREFAGQSLPNTNPKPVCTLPPEVTTIMVRTSRPGFHQRCSWNSGHQKTHTTCCMSPSASKRAKEPALHSSTWSATRQLLISLPNGMAKNLSIPIPGA